MQHVILPPCVKQLRADRFRLFRSFHSKHPVCTRLLLSPAQEPLLRTHGFYLHTETPRERPIRPAEVTHTDTHTHTHTDTHTLIQKRRSHLHRCDTGARASLRFSSSLIIIIFTSSSVIDGFDPSLIDGLYFSTLKLDDVHVG